MEATTFRSGATGNFSLDIDATAASINCFRNLGTLPTGTTSISGTWNGDCASTHQSGSYARFYAFTLTRRTQVQIDLRSAADAYLYLLRGSDSAGLIVDEDDDGGSTGNNSLLDLTLEAGTYTVEATTFRSGATGNFSLDIDATAASINCFRNLGTLPTGTTSISGTWNGDCASTHQSGSYARFYAFTLTRRTRVQIDLRSAADAYLYLLRGSDSAGLIVDEDDDGGSTGNNSLLDLTLEAGTYTVEATTFRSGATGNFSLDIDATAASINCFRNLGTLPTGTTSISGTWNGDCALPTGGNQHLRDLERRLRIYPPERQLRSLLRLYPDPTHPGADRLEVGGGRLSLLAEGVRLRRVDSGRGRRWRKHRQQLAARPHA